MKITTYNREFKPESFEYSEKIDLIEINNIKEILIIPLWDNTLSINYRLKEKEYGLLEWETLEKPMYYHFKVEDEDNKKEA